MTLHRTPINPVRWSLALGFPQGELATGVGRTLHISGQTAMDADGRPQHDGDLAAQLSLSIDNLAAVLHAAEMDLAHLVRLTVYSTDVDALMSHYGVLAGRLAAAGAAPVTTLLGVTRLAVAGQLVELDGMAVD